MGRRSDKLSKAQIRRIKKKGIGLALGAGGLKGFFHIGVLEALEMAGIPVQAIAGSSAGSLAGVLYAYGLSIDEIKEYAVNISGMTSTWLGSLQFSSVGLIKSDNLSHFLEEEIGVKDFSDLKIPLYCVATDLISGEEIIISEGSIAESVRASISLPGIFAPVIKDKQVLIDGGVKEYIPMRALKQNWDGPMMAVWLTPPVKNPKDIRLKKNDNAIRNIIEQFPGIKDSPIFPKNKKEKLDASLMVILLRAWDILAADKTKYDIEKFQPEILIQIDEKINPGLGDMNKDAILSVIEAGKNAALEKFKELKLYEE